ncbi:hypothetical protein [Enterobacter sp. BIDMC 29]|nr:hypothetical protein [Enterobacter sp. BIDMC 29]
MTIAQRQEQKGREEGRQEGIQLGEQRGIDRNTVMAMTGLTDEDLQHITH